MNVASNTIITDDSALGYVNAAEDIDLTPLKSFFMKRSEFITVDSEGTFKIKNLRYPATEITGVFYQFSDLYQQNEYLQYVDPVTFGKGYGTVYTDALYTITTDTDGTNDQVIQVYPAPPSAQIGVEYYCDWPKLGDLTTNSTLQQNLVQITGTASAAGTILFGTTINGVSVSSPVTVNIGDTAAQLQTRIAAAAINFQSSAGNNVNNWYIQPVASTTNLTFTSPSYISDVATLTITGVPAGLTITTGISVNPFIQTVQTNWFLYQYPYLYYYAALKHAYNGLEDLERYQLVEKDFTKALTVFQQLTATAEWGGVHRQSDYNQNVIW